MAVIGIDLGTTNSLACVWKNSSPVIIKNTLGSIITPSVVGIDEDGNIVVGEVAKERLISHPDRTASEFKRTLGTKKIYRIGTNGFSSEQMSSLVLKKIREDAEAFLGEEVTEAVISVPAYFDDCRRNATKQAAEMSGLKVERLINEPSAAALAYMQNHGFEDGTYMVIDFGGGTLDVSIIDSFDSIMEILAVAGNNQLGGKDINEAVYTYFIKENNLDENTKKKVDRIKETITPNTVLSVTVENQDGVRDTIELNQNIYTVKGQNLADEDTFFNKILCFCWRR